MLHGLRNETRPPYTRETLWADLKAGVTLVASYVPTTMALGVISGMGPLAGLWCGVFVGVVAAVCGGTRAMVSGPSAVLAVITATLLMGGEVSLPELAVIIVMAGAIQMVLGLAGVGRYISYMPHIVLTGFMSGIGVLLLSTQVEKLFRLGTSDSPSQPFPWPCSSNGRPVSANSSPRRRRRSGSAGSLRSSCPVSCNWALSRLDCRSRYSRFRRSTSYRKPSDRRC